MNDHASHTHDTPSGVKPETGLSLGWILEWLQSLWEAITGGGHQPHPHSHPIQHFTLDKVILHFEHPEGTTTVQLSQAIAGFLEQGQNQPWKTKLVPPKPEEILTFRSLKDVNNKVLSIVPTQLRNGNTDELELIELLKGIQKDISPDFLPVTNDITLNAVAPNWFVGSATHGISTTGPGGWPVEAPQPSSNGWLLSGKQDQNTRADAPSLFDNNPSKKIHVAILDTAPAKLDLDEALSTRWPGGHPLLERLWGVNGKLRLHTSLSVSLSLLDVGLSGHGYLMPDHGLFVAGIINSIAPQAELHLIKTFTPSGISSAETIARALLEALENPVIKRPLVINLSFNLSEDKDDRLPPEIRSMVKTWQELFARLANLEDVIVVAAAGNDSERDDRKPTRFLAASDCVVGVGALPKESLLPSGKYEAASYSNIAHRHQQNGYMTLGGEPGPGQGILGVYISEFPVYAPVYSKGCLALLWQIFTGKTDDWKGLGHLPPDPYGFTSDQVRYRPNRTGWAWWAGTSFATPVISGILANWCSLPDADRAAAPAGRPINLENAKQALKARSQTTTTVQGENVILVTQG